MRDDVETGLEAKFSIPYLTAYTLLHGPPALDDFEAVDADARRLSAAAISIRRTARCSSSSRGCFSVAWRRSQRSNGRAAPRRDRSTPPAWPQRFGSWPGSRLDGVLDDSDRPARDVLSAAGLS